MQVDQALISRLVDLERSYLDQNETVQKIDKRIWAICARQEGMRKDDGTLEKTAIGKLQKAVIAGKCEDVMLCLRTNELVAARDLLENRQEAIAEEMAGIASRLPCYEWFTTQRGVKDIMFARLVAKAGRGLHEFESPPKLWKRFGLDVANGAAPKPKAGEKLSYDPRRKAFALGVLGTNLMMQNPRWKAVYDWRKQYERDRAMAEGKTVKASAAITPKQAASGKFMSDGHVHARARRYMVKQFLKALWSEWTGETKPEELPGFIREQRVA
jgi:hypothetical protein